MFENKRKLSSILEFFRMFQASLCRKYMTNLDAKGSKKKRKDVSYQLLQQLYQNIFYMNGRLSKIRSVHTYVLKAFILVILLFLHVRKTQFKCHEFNGIWTHDQQITTNDKISLFKNYIFEFFSMFCRIQKTTTELIWNFKLMRFFSNGSIHCTSAYHPWHMYLNLHHNWP